MTLDELIKKTQKAIGVTPDGDWGPRTTDRAREFDLVEIRVAKRKEILEPVKPATGMPPWLAWARKLRGKRETDQSLIALLVPTWAKLGLPGYKKLAGRAYAWCGVLVASGLIAAGVSYQKNGAGARNWQKYDVEINWRKDGIPRGAIVPINHNGKCDSSDNNHVAYSDGDCAPGDLKDGAINLTGGNQSDKVSTVAFSVKEICGARWPAGYPMPKLPITKSDGCKGKAGGGSTR